MAHNEELIDTFASVFEVTFGGNEPISRDNPIMFDIEETDGFVYDEAHFRAWPYERYNGVEVVRIDVDTKKIQFADLRAIERWVTRENGHLPFATVRVHCDQRRTVHLTITHTLMADTLSHTQLEQAVDSMYFMWKKCSDMLDELEPIGEEGDDAPDDLDLDLDLSDIANLDDPAEADAASPMTAHTLAADEDSVESILAELNALIGLQPVKALVHQLAAQQDIARQRKENGLNVVLPSPHLVFLGNPGTGKTTVARLIGRLYKAFGLVSEGHVVEADRASLVAGYIGQTAIRTREVCQAALGGVLFIDEAYSLNVDGRDYGSEAIETLLTFMEKYRGQFAVVVAGYPDKMMDFLGSNPGLKSRFDLTLSFPDYSDEELMRIFTDLVDENDYVLTDDARDRVLATIESWSRGTGFGNAREVRRLFQQVVGLHAVALMGRDRLDSVALRHITEEMIPAPVSWNVKTTCEGYSPENTRVPNFGYL